jgi:DNA polymerase III psi subunit
MAVDPNHEQRLRELQEQLRHAQAITPEFMADVIVRACLRLQAHRAIVKARVTRLIQSEAFADATLALLELELPQWKLRRLIYEDGEWHCSLSKHIELPAELDDMAEASHECLPLAILGAFVEARHHSLTADHNRLQSVPQVRPTQGFAICCDNFA